MEGYSLIATSSNWAIYSHKGLRGFTLKPAMALFGQELRLPHAFLGAEVFRLRDEA
jgi:hypothetical protein